ncbi:MAG: HTTM domain-containing protein [Planctomycetaceae bacterium]|nr:HTTM domain-containing protein [Planctomycetaceae bacterium]
MNAPLPQAPTESSEPIDIDHWQKIGSTPDSSAQSSTEHRGVFGQYVNELGRQASSVWNQFWFTPADPATLGAIRVLIGAMLVYTHFVWGLDFESFFGPESWVTNELVQRYQQNDWVFSFWFVLPHTYAYPVHLACLGVLTLFTFGVFTRVTSLLSLLIVISYANRLPTAQYGLDQINGILMFYLAVGPSGAAYSIDSWLRRPKESGPRTTAHGFGWDAYGPSIHANIASRLIQLHMCVIYLFAGLGKLQGTAWWDGNAMWLAFANREYQTLDMTWLCDYPWAVHVMTHFTIFWELTYCVFVWIPVLTPIVLFFAVVLHVGIGLCMGMWTFALAMIFGNLIFVPPDIVRRFVSRLTARRHRVKSFGR